MKLEEEHFVKAYAWTHRELTRVIGDFINKENENEILVFLFVIFDHYLAINFLEERRDIELKIMDYILLFCTRKDDYYMEWFFDRALFYSGFIDEMETAYGYWLKTYTDMPTDKLSNCLRAFGDIIKYPKLIECYEDREKAELIMRTKKKREHDLEVTLAREVLRLLRIIEVWFCEQVESDNKSEKTEGLFH